MEGYDIYVRINVLDLKGRGKYKKWFFKSWCFWYKIENFNLKF